MIFLLIQERESDISVDEVSESDIDEGEDNADSDVGRLREWWKEQLCWTFDTSLINIPEFKEDVRPSTILPAKTTNF